MGLFVELFLPSFLKMKKYFLIVHILTFLKELVSQTLLKKE